jgi:hypothetical protein
VAGQRGHQAVLDQLAEVILDQRPGAGGLAAVEPDQLGAPLHGEAADQRAAVAGEEVLPGLPARRLGQQAGEAGGQHGERGGRFIHER